MLAADGAVAGMNDAAGQWLEDLGGHADGSDLPIEISALAVRLRHLPPTEPAMPRLQVRTRSGRWAVLHASWMTSQAEKVVTVIIQEAAPADVAPLIMAAYGLTDRERTISALVCQGMSTRQIAGRLHLTADTVQDHLKSVFDRTGVHSRGQLVAAIFATRLPAPCHRRRPTQSIWRLRGRLTTRPGDSRLGKVLGDLLRVHDVLERGTINPRWPEPEPLRRAAKSLRAVGDQLHGAACRPGRHSLDV